MGDERTSLRVLIVDDERIIAETLGQLVRTAGHIVRVAHSGKQAAAIATELQPHITISDVIIPGMDGIELAIWLEEHHPECRVLLLSGDMDSISRADRELAGRQVAILSKPLHPGEIIQFIAICAAERSRTDEDA